MDNSIQKPRKIWAMKPIDLLPTRNMESFHSSDLPNTGTISPVSSAPGIGGVSSSMQHQYHHLKMIDYMFKFISQHRKSIMIEDSWVIESVICCPYELPHAEGSVSWNAEISYAWIKIRCDLPEHLLVHVLTHELFELFCWETTEIFFASVEDLQPKAYQNFVVNQFRGAQNRSVERMATRYLGSPRPGHHVDDLQSNPQELSPSLVWPDEYNPKKS